MRSPWVTSTCGIVCERPGACLTGCICPCCTAYAQRRRLLEGDMSRYRCCAQKSDCCCCGSCGDRGACCLLVEATLCLPCAINGNRELVMTEYGLADDVVGDELIHTLECLCYFVAALLEFEQCVLVGDVCMLALCGCLLAQQEHQLDTMGYPSTGKVRGLQDVSEMVDVVPMQ
jgi:hypothetical protein